MRPRSHGMTGWSLHELLWREWDPIGWDGWKPPRDEYDSYADALERMLRDGVTREAVSSYLQHVERDLMGLTVDDERVDACHRLAGRIVDEHSSPDVA